MAFVARWSLSGLRLKTTRWKVYSSWCSAFCSTWYLIKIVSFGFGTQLEVETPCSVRGRHSSWLIPKLRLRSSTGQVNGLPSVSVLCLINMFINTFN